MDARERKELKKAQDQVNNGLHAMGLKFWSYIPVYEIDSLLEDNGFNATEPAIYCGREGNLHEEVGHGKYLSMTWHKHDSGSYEIVAYLN